MGTCGVPWEHDRVAIIEALKRERGRLTFACKLLKVSYPTLKKYIDQDCELTQLLSDLRNEFDEDLLDSAEDVLKLAMNKASIDLTNALKASFYALNNKGKSRGYAHPKDNDDIILSNARSTIQLTERIEKLEASLYSTTIERPIVENGQSLLHQEQRGEKDTVRDELGTEDSIPWPPFQ